MMLKFTTTRVEHQWYAMRLREPVNRGRRTCLIWVERETYVNARGKPAVRAVKGSGRRVFVAEKLLRDAGFRVFLPVEKVWRQVNRFKPEKVQVAKPLLTGWVFVGWREGENRWQELDALGQVSAVLGSANGPAKIGEALMIRLMRQFGAGYLGPEEHRYMRTGCEFAVGDDVRIMSGPMADFPMRVESIHEESVRGVVDIFGRATVVEMATREVSAK